MFILPYVVSTRKLPYLTLHTIYVLTVGGINLWQEEDPALSLKEDILEPNGLPLLSTHAVEDIHFCRLDPSQFTLSEYYQWEEVSLSEKDVFCWRTFYEMEVCPSSSLPPSSPSSPFLTPPSTARLGPYSIEELLTHLKPRA